MSAQLPPPGGPGGPDDLERLLAEALRREADQVTPAGDGLARIRERTARNRVGAFDWLRPQALVGGAAAIAVVALGVVVVGQVGGGDNENVVQEPPPPVVALATPDTFVDEPLNTEMSPDPVIDNEPNGPEGGEERTVDTELTPVPTNLALTQPVTEGQESRKSDGGIPVDNGGNHVAILAPVSGGTYDSPLTVAGVARVFEANVTIDVSQNGRVLKRAFVTATAAAPELGDWQATIALVPGNYRIDAYALSPEDGTTRLATDSIWITVRSATSAPSASPSATPTATRTSSPSPSSTARPTSTSTPVAGSPGSAGSAALPATEPDA